MDEAIRQAITILRGMWQRRWIGLAAAWIVGIVAAVAILRFPAQYEASARIYVDTQSVLKPLMAGLAVQPNYDQQLVILSRTLISRPNVEKLIRMADLDLAVATKEQQEKTVDELMKKLEIKGGGGETRDNIYVLAYRDPKPETAKRVIQALTSIFVESGLGGKRKDTDSAKKFIDEQVKGYERKLEEAEDRLKEFKIRHMGVIGAEGKDYFSRIGEAQTALGQARLELREAENSRDALRRQIAGEDAVLLPEAASPAASTAVPEIDGRIEALKRNLDALMQKYTDQHPDVVGTKRVIEELEQQKKQELAARRKQAGSASAMGGSSNPVSQQLRVSLAEAEASVASLRTRVAEYEARYARLKESAKMVPQIEAEFAQLNRDYAVHKKNYDSLVSRRESAELGSEMASVSGLADFRLIDPPRVSSEPVAPNRMLLAVGALLVALGAGAFASFVASQVWPTFLDSRTLRDVTGLPVLGTVSMLVGDELRRKERRGVVGWISGLAALLGSYGAGILVLFLLSTRTV